MSLLKLLKRNRLIFEREMVNIDRHSFLSAATRTVHLATSSVIVRYAFGDVIDIGCGRQPYRKLILSCAKSYTSLDIEKRAEAVDHVADIQNVDPGMFKTQFDCAVAFMVWEHLPAPVRTARIIFNLLRDDGLFILTVPHLSRLHEQPNDYFRYTAYGIRAVLEQAGFEIIDVVACGGILSFIGHQVSSMLVCLFLGVPVLKQLSFMLNKLLLVYPLLWGDAMLDKVQLAPLAYTCVARKRSHNGYTK